MDNQKYFNRELSWLSFNYRVLQEAKDKSLPLFERIKFLAIYSSNLDEFFRVRVASLRALLNLKSNSSKKLNFEPEVLLKTIKRIVHKQQEEFGRILNSEIINELLKERIFFVDEKTINEYQKEYLNEYFDVYITPIIQPSLLDSDNINTFLKNKSIYLAVRLIRKKSVNPIKKKSTVKRYKYALIEIPFDKIGRFITLPEKDGSNFVIFVDDVIKLNIGKIFPGYIVESYYSIKLTRDAELYIDDEFSGNLLQKIKKGLSKRKSGAPSRFLYDKSMPTNFLRSLRKSFRLSKDDLMPGGRYHNLNDFFEFPDFGKKHLMRESFTPLPNKLLDISNSYFDSLSQQDILLSYPYQSYNYVINFLNEAANDKNVKSIRITLYRVAKDSAIVKALISAAKNGKKVEAFVEVKARFDEELNFSSAEQLEHAGVTVYYSFPNLKVHSKICLIEKVEDGKNKFYSYIATGNFNENTAKIYTDFAMITKNQSIGADLKKIFKVLSGKSEKECFTQLLVAPFNLRDKLNQLIDNEISNAKNGLEASITLKLNSLEDWKIIDKIYEASEAGVKVYLIIRGINCLLPFSPIHRKNIFAISIIDSFLEHGRVYIFHNKGDKKYFISSSDFMRRNLNRRIEVALPILDDRIKTIIQSIIDLQLKDNVKARILNINQNNRFVKSGVNPIRSQYLIYEYLKASEINVKS
ncbi:polyphosphate kinase 1 [Ignavibacterium sp.]|uniref:polyphosphate kinase 1 n=1 Tax=Ignavibacterium sp. TaxID=2651167 RepID=UPI00307ED3CD